MHFQSKKKKKNAHNVSTPYRNQPRLPPHQRQYGLTLLRAPLVALVVTAVPVAVLVALPAALVLPNELALPVSVGTSAVLTKGTV